jgi:hypothetical protein
MLRVSLSAGAWLDRRRTAARIAVWDRTPSLDDANIRIGTGQSAPSAAAELSAALTLRGR